jgi:predicted GNAT superfamily acetyltransferase
VRLPQHLEKPRGLELQLKMCSHMAGVLPAWRGAGLGMRLKMAQRTAILEQDVTNWVTWTYDPLIRTNAVFNVHRLGAICSTYHENLYGELPDGLNAGTPSDRCQVDWWLDSARVVERVHGDEWRTRNRLPPRTQVLSAAIDERGLQVPPTAKFNLDGNPLALPLPDDIYAIRHADSGLGLEWRLWMRSVLQLAFALGYLIVDCGRHEDGQWRYLLAANPA